MLVILNNLTIIIDVDETDSLSMLSSNYIKKDSRLAYNVIKNYPTFIYYKYYAFYDKIDGTIEVFGVNKEELIEKLKQYSNDYYYVLSINKNDKVYGIEILHHSLLQVSGQAATFFRNSTIDNLLKEL